MQGGFVIAVGILEVDDPALSRLRGILELEAVESSGQVVEGRAILADLRPRHTIAPEQLEREVAIQSRAGDNGTALMRCRLAKVPRLEVDEVDQARAGRRDRHLEGGRARDILVVG